MRIGVYLGDQVWTRTLSKGIYSYSRMLVDQLVRRLPAHEFVVIVNSVNRLDMLESTTRPVTIVTLPASSGSGATRLVADHLMAPLLAHRYRLDLLHFPKGFVPWLPIRSRLTATLHDTIPLFYQDHYPRQFPRRKIWYLRQMYLRTLRVAHGLLTDSAFSAASITAFAATAKTRHPRLFVCPPAPDPILTDSAGPPVFRSPYSLLHLGSPLPHKRTCQTIELFRAFNRRRDGRWQLRVTGLDHLPQGWGLTPGPDVLLLGSVPGSVLREELRRARALLLLSEIEGFGLPALEAWFLGTPVCYATQGSLIEILEGVPGACAALEEEVFAAALEEVLALDDAELAYHQKQLRERFAVDCFGTRVAAIFDGWLSEPRPSV